ncbi:MAG: MiaB/RimO family radical SAM methylthiotransferase [Candidatus Omnitrophota bacterium]
MDSSRRIGLISLGCSRNLVDSEKILSDIRRQGGRVVPVEEASTVIVNTCAFTQEAKEESIGVICDLLDLKKKGKIKKVLVRGCLSQRYSRELRQSLPEVDGFEGVVGFKDRFDRAVRLTPAHLAYMKISEGCAHRCSYCAIPFIKGPLRSRAVDLILKEAAFLERQGVRELDIIGQDTTSYGLDRCAGRRGWKKSLPLVVLLKKILSSTTIPWIRLLYLHPLHVTRELMELVAAQPRICPYIDLPLQHINDRILECMNRPLGREKIVRLVRDLRRLIPGVCLRTTLIVGFPSETRKEFQELLDFVQTMQFDRLGAFVYSREEGTPAYAFGSQVSAKEKERRFRRLLSLQKKISAKIQESKIGRCLDILIDEEDAGQGVYLGRTQHDAPEVDGVVYVKSSRPLKPGAMVRAQVRDAYEYDLVAEVRDESGQ